MPDFTLDDLEQARKDLQHWDDRWANDSSNNPDKHEGRRREARARVRMIEIALKQIGKLPLTDTEKLEVKLDKLFPNAQSREIVSYGSIRYQRQFSPLEHSRSGKSVTVWEKTWHRIDPA